MIDALPVLNRTDATFKTDVDTFFSTDLPAFSVQAEDARVQINSNTTIAQTQADLASAQVSLAQAQTLLATQQAQAAASSALSAGAIAWVSGTTYAIGNLRYSPINSQVYRRLTAGAGTTDPSQDAVNWRVVNGLTSELIVLPFNNLPSMRPSLNLDFANNQSVDPRITFTRASVATRTNNKGLIELVPSGVPRIDFDAVTGVCKGLLIEESRTNLLTYSEVFSDAAWLKGELTVTPNTVVAPDGTVTGDTLLESTTVTAGHYIEQFKVLTGSLDYTASYFLKANGRYFVDVSLSRSGVWTDAGGARFDLLNGVVTSNANGKAKITPAGGGWFRCSCTGTKTSTTENAYSRLTLINEANTATYTGDGTSGLYIWGAQLEVGAFPTSYIPTVASQVTRAADVASMTGSNFSSWYKQEEGSFSMEFQGVTTSGILVSANDGTNSERVQVSLGSASGGNVTLTVTDGGVASAVLTHPITVTSTTKLAYKYKANDFASSANGLTVLTDVSGTTPTVDRLTIGCSGAGIIQPNGHIRSISYYPKALTSAELQALSTQ